MAIFKNENAIPLPLGRKHMLVLEKIKSGILCLSTQKQALWNSVGLTQINVDRIKLPHLTLVSIAHHHCGHLNGHLAAMAKYCNSSTAKYC